MIQPDIFISQALRIFILIIPLYRIFQDALCKIEAAVPVDSPAHQMIHSFFFHLAEICFPITQFHISIGLFQRFRRQNGDLMFFPALFFHLLCNGAAFQICHIAGKLLYIAFQSLLVHLLGKKILPGIFHKFFQSYGKHLFQRSMSSFKHGIDHRIIQTVDDLY